MRVILKQILEALEFIHSHNIVHCDLKPENILFQDVQRCAFASSFTRSAQIKLVDFGGSNFITSLKSLSPRQLYIQSRSYRAPEIILGTDVDERIDMWSLGCIAAELYTHRLLFDNSSVANLLTSASALLEPVPECLLLMAGAEEGRRVGHRPAARVAGAGARDDRPRLRGLRAQAAAVGPEPASDRQPGVAASLYRA